MQVGSNDFRFSVDNFGATFSDAAFGTSVSNILAHTKGTASQLIAAASVTTDIFAMTIGFCGANTAANVRRFLADILVDPAGGSSWSVLIPDLYVNSPALGEGGYWYTFPLYVKSGSSIGMQQQCSSAAIALRCGIRLYGKPSNPSMMRVGTKVQAIGVNASNTDGVAVTPGTNAMGSYSASLGTTSSDCWYWQLGVGSGDTTMNSVYYNYEVAAGDATNKQTVADNILVKTNASEAMSKSSTYGSNIKQIAAGADVYVRAQGTAAPDGTISVIAYGVT